MFTKPQPSIKVAAIQAAPVAFDLAASLKKVTLLTAEAASNGAELVVFPEAFLSAYPWRYAFDATVGSREPRGPKWFAKYYESSIRIPSSEFDVLRDCARENGVVLSVGIVEQAENGGGTLFCTTVLIGKDGELLHKHRKLVPTGAERVVWGRGAGDSLKVVDPGFGWRTGGLICWENYMPAARLALYQLGIEIYIIPNADDGPTWTATVQHIAKEGRCFVISVNQFCKVSDFPADYPPFIEGSSDRNPENEGSVWQKDDAVNSGGSCILGPLGTFLAEPVRDKEVILYATLQHSELIEARMDFDPVGTYSRPDIFSLSVNKKPGDNVVFND
ncbi:Carbon-nitrogen hydrolase [Glarea lozoyensis ATCC 20868]|uniref:Carbon-nitrogen hydrolase n=1 Tax=Glarea lozoyensis (strain ATCC 20868 / MF5171) TaxID=1116229 RepID=S3DFT2_GLAL2|nr:Carbon-nitrogen hydrolase [Glarea lozoyensis ATCC 20868]EPE30811.1 Carbon-nitrogen hydrolase [Glarea lozoyensis ATCC 20868]